MDLVVLVKKMSVLINFLLQNTNQSLAKSYQILLVMSDRTDKFRELWDSTRVRTYAITHSRWAVANHYTTDTVSYLRTTQQNMPIFLYFNQENFEMM
jgi:hypothetical protein